MGNIMVSGDEFSLFKLSFKSLSLALAWLLAITCFIVRWIVIEPWGYKSIAKAAIQDNEDRRKARFQRAYTLCKDLDEKVRNEILALDLFQLQESLQADKYNAITVVKAYAYKALQVHEEINCLAEFLIESFEKADELDKKYSGSAEKPPLYGLPFSVKSNFFVKDYNSCVGLSKYLSDVKSKDCTIVSLLYKLGAVPFVMTNVPQALLSFVCSNVVYGTTGHPKNNLRIPGGSSGGEAALLGAKGSVFGTGSDLAGSLRIPASMCGIVTLKPTEARLSVRNCHGGIPGRGRMALGTGFYTHTVDEHVYILGLILDSNYLHETAPKHVPLPLRRALIEEKFNNKSIRIGYFTDDGFLKPTPGCARVVNQTVEKLTDAGYELIRFDLPRPFEAADVCFKSIMTDGGSYLTKLYSNEIVDKHMKSFVSLINLPLFVRYLGSIVLGKFSPQARVVARSYVKTIEELRLNQERVDNYIDEIFDLFNELQIDALICPAFTIPAVPHKYPSLLGACAFSTAIWNMVDFPAGTVPIDNWNEQDEQDLKNEQVWPVGSNFILKLMRDACSDSKGMPLGVQIVTRPYQEEICLAVMKTIEGIWRQ